MANQSSNTATATSKPRVLSVCNDGSVLRTRGMVLQNAGYNVYSAEDYGQAVNQCAASRFDVAVLSASLPYDDRIALAAEVKKRWPATHVVMYCAIHEMPAHADAVIDPFDGPGALLFAIESTLTNSGPVARAPIRQAQRRPSPPVARRHPERLQP